MAIAPQNRVGRRVLLILLLAGLAVLAANAVAGFIVHYIGPLTPAVAALLDTVILGAVFILIPETVIGVITTSEEVTAIARPILQIAGAAQMFYASGIVLAHALQAAGATVFVMIVEVLTHWVIFLPLAFLIGVTWGGGLSGAWLALPVYIFSYSGLIYVKYQKGSWLQIKV